MKFAYLLLAAFLSVAVAEGCVYSQYRLPHHIRPEHYDLTLGVDSKEYMYEGKVKISFVVDSLPHKVPSNIIVLHASPSLLVQDIKFTDQTTSTSSSLGRLLETKQHESNAVESSCVDEENELLVITMKNEFKANTQGVLEITFAGEISGEADHLKGFYQNKYQDESGIWKSVVSTQFEAASAREAFPCFDEPSFKATFDITLQHDPELVALSNAPVESEGQSGEYKVSKFKRTPRMSTYLLAWTVGTYDYLEQVIGDGRLKIRAYTLPGRKDQAKFALETAVRAIALMEEFFDVPFAMEKIDMVGLPTFDAGAMENWGLIFYHDGAFLYDEKNSKAAAKGWVASTVVHELAHQWFGNLVTMAWWNDLWLNEGFATWMQNYFTDQLYPEFEWQNQWILDDHVKGLDSDAQLEVHSIQVEETGRDLDALFDDIVYKKACEVLRHIHDDYLGPERFREGIRKYIKKHLYGNTEASDLWGAMADVSGLPVDKLMKSWVTQPGHPEIEVELLPSGEIKLRQQRHLTEEPAKKRKSKVFKQQWMIPMSVIFADDKGNRNTEKLIMESRELRVKVPEWFDSNNKNHWVKLNAGFKGFYRVKYSRELIMRLEQPVRSKSLETYDRLNLIYDFFTDVIPESLTHEDIASIFSWFQEDQEGAIILLLFDAFEHVRDMLEADQPDGIEDDDDIQANLPAQDTDGPAEKIKAILLKSYEAIYAKQGFKIDLSEASISDAEGLSLAFGSLIENKYEPLVKDALKDFDAKGNKNHVNLRGAIYKAVGKFGNQAQVDKLREILKETSDPAERHRINTVLTGIHFWRKGEITLPAEGA